MAKWTIGEADNVLIIETNDDQQIIIDIPSRQPIQVGTDVAQTIRTMLGTAIGGTQNGPSHD